jgi:hypothetical protein
MEKSKLKKSNTETNINSANNQKPWLENQKLQNTIEREAHLLAKRNGYRNSAHFYLLSVARDFGCVLP